LRDGTGRKRQRAAAVQSLAEIPSGPANAKRLGLRQPSGALERGNVNSECRRGNVLRRNQMDVPERGCPHPQPLRQTWPRGILWMRTGRFTRCGWDSRAPNAVGATGRAAIRWTIEAMGV